MALYLGNQKVAPIMKVGTPGDGVTDVKVDGTSVVTNHVANIDLSGKQEVLTAGSNITIARDPETEELVISATGGSISGVTDVKVNDESVVTEGVANISLADVATSGSFNDLIDTPTIPTVNNTTITFTQGGVEKGSITLNQDTAETIALDAGGTTYTEGRGIDINSSNEISVLTGDGLTFDSDDNLAIDYEEVQKVLTPGTGIDITNDTITVTGVKETHNNSLLKFYKCTQAEYDALTSKDSSTMYVIIG